MPSLLLGLAMLLHACGHTALVYVAAGSVTGLSWGRNSVHGAEILRWVGVGVFIAAAKALLGTYTSSVQMRVARHVAEEARSRALAVCLHRGKGSQGDGAWVSGFMVHAHDIERGVVRGFFSAVGATIELACLLSVSLYLSAALGLTTGVVLLVFAALLSRIRARQQHAVERERLLVESLGQALDEAVRHRDLWIAYGAEGKARDVVHEAAAKLFETSHRVGVRRAWMGGLNEVLFALLLFAIAFLSNRGILSGPALPGGLALLLVPFFLAYRPMRQLSEARGDLERAEAAFRRLGELSDRAPPPVAPLCTASQPIRCEALEVRGLVLSRGLLPPLSLRFPAHTVTVLRGATGIGKTTFFRTLLGLCEEQGGAVFLGGNEVRGSARAPFFAWAMQETPVLAATLEENLLGPHARVFSPRSSDVFNALAARGRGEILGLSRTLSGGEARWLSLLRAELHPAPILLLDEPSVGLDPEQKSLFLQWARERAQDRTLIMISHDAAVEAIADQVVVLSESRIQVKSRVRDFEVREGHAWGREAFTIDDQRDLVPLDHNVS